MPDNEQMLQSRSTMNSQSLSSCLGQLQYSSSVIDIIVENCGEVADLTPHLEICLVLARSG